MTNLEEPVAVVIGGSSSIGSAISDALAQRFDQVIATYHKGSARSASGNFSTLCLDVTNPVSRQDFVKEMSAAGRAIGCLVLLSGIITGNSLQDYDDETAQKVIGTNMTGLGLFVRDALPLMAPQGRVLVVNSIAAERGSFDPFYAASKGAMLAFAKSLATARNNDISVISMLPGPIEDSSMFTEMAPDVQRRHMQDSPIGQILTAQDLASVIADVSQPHWIGANGAVIRLNCGAYV